MVSEFELAAWRRNWLLFPEWMADPADVVALGLERVLDLRPPVPASWWMPERPFDLAEVERVCWDRTRPGAKFPIESP